MSMRRPDGYFPASAATLTVTIKARRLNGEMLLNGPPAELEGSGVHSTVIDCKAPVSKANIPHLFVARYDGQPPMDAILIQASTCGSAAPPAAEVTGICRRIISLRRVGRVEARSGPTGIFGRRLRPAPGRSEDLRPAGTRIIRRDILETGRHDEPLSSDD